MQNPEIEDIALLGETNFRNKRIPFGIKTDDRARHVYAIGKTGMGKSVLLENMAIQDIKAGKGMAFIDPHGESAERILDFVPKSRVNDVVYMNPADIDYPIAFNVLEQVDPQYKHLVASGLVGVFKKLWADSWGPRLEYILRNTVMALLESPGSTLLGIMRMLVNNNYRKKVVAQVTDPVVKEFWITEFANYNERTRVEAVLPIQNKVGQFLTSPLIRNIFGQTKSAINIEEIMNEGKILIVNVAKGRVGEDTSELLGATIITKIQLAALARAAIKPEERRPFYLYVDEFQNFATESFATILSEARKYKLNLTIAHQYIEQLDEEVRDAVLGNVGTIISFRVGANDAFHLAKEYEPTFTETDFVNLAKYNIYLKLMIDGVASQPFSATTLPPRPDVENNADKVIKVSRERYASPRELVEEKIARWSGVQIIKSNQQPGDSSRQAQVDQMRDKMQARTGDQTGQPQKQPAGQRESSRRKSKSRRQPAPRGAQSQPKERFETVCAMCGDPAFVPFKPEPGRPAYCDRCWPKAKKQRDQQKQKEAQEQKEAEDLKKKAETPISVSEVLEREPIPFSGQKTKDPNQNEAETSDQNSDKDPGKSQNQNQDRTQDQGQDQSPNRSPEPPAPRPQKPAQP